MRTMACVLFLVIVLVAINEVLGNSGMSCNTCIRSGGNWCKDRVGDRCVSHMEDSWCPQGREELMNIQVEKPGKFVSPSYVERSLFIDTPNILDIQYPGPNEIKPRIHKLNSTQSLKINIQVQENRCPTKENCTVTIKAVPTTMFCNSNGGPSETAFVSVQIGSIEQVLVKYNVACACPCSLNVVKAADECHNHGDYSCGQCTCQIGWKGEFCDQFNKEDCQGSHNRGDQNGQCTHPVRTNVNCSGNGYCSACETCICDDNRLGSQYFNHQYYCEDICLNIFTNDCEECFFNTTGACTGNKCYNMFIETYNETISREKDSRNRTIWVPCRATVDGCDIDYVTRKAENEEIFVMIMNSCYGIEGAIVADSKVPMILGVLAGIAIVAAAAGFLIWKHMTAVAPVPLNESQYTNIDAEDCTGENPLYKPPTSSFKNPTYGKW